MEHKETRIWGDNRVGNKGTPYCSAMPRMRGPIRARWGRLVGHARYSADHLLRTCKMNRVCWWRIPHSTWARMRSIALHICTFRHGKSQLNHFNFQVYTISKYITSNVHAANSQFHYMQLKFWRRKLLCFLDKDPVCLMCVCPCIVAYA